MTFQSLFVDQKTGSAHLQVNFSDFVAALRTAFFAALSVGITTLIGLIANLKTGVVIVGPMDITPVLVFVLTFLLRFALQYLATNKEVPHDHES